MEGGPVSLSYLYLFFMSLVPFVEARGSIPMGIYLGMDPMETWIVCTSSNMLVSPILYLIYPRIERFVPTDRFAKRLERKASEIKSKYGIWRKIGVIVFVALPIPGSGAYSGFLLSLLLGIKTLKEGVPLISLGVMISSSLVLSASIGLLKMF
ncbi:hypothetical protein DRN46_06875 [Thermococci archaeon]|nr:MAG: hypothetical protein DRN46_06875 [Thermococci archaeon]